MKLAYAEWNTGVNQTAHSWSAQKHRNNPCFKIASQTKKPPSTEARWKFQLPLDIDQEHEGLSLKNQPLGVFAPPPTYSLVFCPDFLLCVTEPRYEALKVSPSELTPNPQTTPPNMYLAVMAGTVASLA